MDLAELQNKLHLSRVEGLWNRRIDPERLRAPEVRGAPPDTSGKPRHDVSHRVPSSAPIRGRHPRALRFIEASPTGFEGQHPKGDLRSAGVPCVLARRWQSRDEPVLQALSGMRFKGDSESPRCWSASRARPRWTAGAFIVGDPPHLARDSGWRKRIGTQAPRLLLSVRKSIVLLADREINFPSGGVFGGRLAGCAERGAARQRQRAHQLPSEPASVANGERAGSVRRSVVRRRSNVSRPSHRPAAG